MDYCSLCGGDKLLVHVVTHTLATALRPCPDCLAREHDKLNAEHAEAVAKLIAENRELNDVFDLQQTRMLTATKKWQEATGKHDIFPDLGRLLEWLLAEMETNDA